MTPPKVTTGGTTVLVVDDEDGIRQALTRFLTRLGYTVQAAANASEALAKQAEHHPQAMLCDIRMPETSGVELLPKVLAQDADLAVLMLTAIDEPRTAIECLKLGAYDYLIKPVDLEELELSLHVLHLVYHVTPSFQGPRAGAALRRRRRSGVARRGCGADGTGARRGAATRLARVCGAGAHRAGTRLVARRPDRRAGQGTACRPCRPARRVFDRVHEPLASAWPVAPSLTRARCSRSPIHGINIMRWRCERRAIFSRAAVAGSGLRSSSASCIRTCCIAADRRPRAP